LAWSASADRSVNDQQVTMSELVDMERTLIFRAAETDVRPFSLS
jgi:hypothetical protein